MQISARFLVSSMHFGTEVKRTTLSGGNVQRIGGYPPETRINSLATRQTCSPNGQHACKPFTSCKITGLGKRLHEFCTLTNPPAPHPIPTHHSPMAHAPLPRSEDTRLDLAQLSNFDSVSHPLARPSLTRGLVPQRPIAIRTTRSTTIDFSKTSTWEIHKPPQNAPNPMT